jgi:hypothetical protein
MEVYLVEQDDIPRVPESELDTEANLEKRLVRTDGTERLVYGIVDRGVGGGEGWE